MSVLSTITCRSCGERKEVSHSAAQAPPGTCAACEEAEASKKRQAHLDHLATLSVDERLRKLEEFAYDHSRSYHHPRPVFFG